MPFALHAHDLDLLLIDAPVVFGHVLATFGAVLTVLLTITIVSVWRAYGVDLIGDYVRRNVERLREKRDLPPIDQSPTRRQRRRRGSRDP